MIQADVYLANAWPAGSDATILYEDFATGLRGHFLAAWLGKTQGREGKFNEHLWRFDVLDHPLCFHRAIEDSVYSAVLIISAHGTAMTPSCLVAWLHEWLVRQVAPDVEVIVSLDPTLRQRRLEVPFLGHCLKRLLAQLPLRVVLTHSEPTVVREILSRRESALRRNLRLF